MKVQQAMKLFEVRFHCPDVQRQEDVMIIGQTLDGSPGINDIDVDYHKHTVRITTANQDGGLDAERKLIGAGYHPADVERWELISHQEPSGT